MTELSAALEEQNPWWSGENPAPSKPRTAQAEVRRILSHRWGVALTGLRRVGKTTIIRQAILESIEHGQDPRRILYFSFDEFPGSSLRDVIRAYEERTGLSIRQGEYLLAFDEIPKLTGWEAQLKVQYDLHKDRVRFLVSGSESLWLRRGMRESLAGRLVELRIDPLSFREYLGFVSAQSPGPEPPQRDLARLWPRYLRSYGLPQLVSVEDLGRADARRYLSENIADRVLYRDLQQIRGGLDVQLLESLYRTLTEEPGQVVELVSLSRELGVDRKTLATYLWFLEMAFVVRKLYNYSKSRRKTERKLKRYHPVLPSVDLVYRDDADAQSRVLETYTAIHLRAEFFWRDPAQHEVDVVLPGPPLSPVEVKFGKIETRGVQTFMQRFGAKEGWIVSSSREETLRVPEGTLRVLPAPKFFLDPPRATPPEGTAPLPVRVH